MKETMAKIFQMVGFAATPEEKVLVLRKYEDQGLKFILKAAFDPEFEWDLPEGEPPTRNDKTIPDGYAENNLRAETRRLYIFSKKYTNVPRARKEALFIGMLEGLHHTDAQLLCAVKDGQLPKLYTGLDADLVRVAFPGLLSDPKRGSEVPE